MAKPPRHDGRRPGELRPITITPDFVPSACGSCLIEAGQTRVICTASLDETLPEWKKASNQGWVTAEYGMLPASTGRRKSRPIGKPDSRATEIQRLIGRVLRCGVDLDRLGPITLTIDCDVLQADGGTRTAAITGGYVAMARALRRAAAEGKCSPAALAGPVAAVSVGIVDGVCLLDLDYREDVAAEVDMNVAMIRGGRFIEIQGTAEKQPFDLPQLEQMLQLARRGISRLMQAQKRAIEGVA